MCTDPNGDPNSPTAQAFCCMRGWSIAVLVFGILEILSSLNSIGPMQTGDPCYICPDAGMGGIDYSKGGFGWCQYKGVWTGDSMCAETEAYSKTNDCKTAKMNSEADCKGKWTTYTCGEANSYWATQLPEYRANSPDQCSALQTTFRPKCCIAGDPPPPSTAGLQFVLLLLSGIVKSIAGGVLSCCAGPPTDGKLKISLYTSATAFLIDFIIFIVVIVWMIGATSPEFAKFVGQEAATFVLGFFIFTIVSQIINLVILVAQMMQVVRAMKIGIGKAGGAGSPMPGMAMGQPVAQATIVQATASTM